jgi:curved DNA-binding protein
MTDYYSTLGVDRSASQDDIKKAYRKLAAQHHPDRGGNTAKFQEIQQAYDVIGDPEKRSNYDNPQPQFGGNGGFHFTQGGIPPGFEDLFANFGGQFGDMFGNRRAAPQRNKTLNIQATITLEEAYSGKELMATLTLPSGREQLIEVKIPAGISDGTTLRIPGLGDDSLPNVQRGDIHLSIHVQPHPDFMRQGDDLLKRLNISCIDAMLGKTIPVSTIDGRILELKIASGTQPGQILAAHGYGMPHVSNSNVKGRLLIQIGITIPETLTEHQKNLLEQFLN